MRIARLGVGRRGAEGFVGRRARVPGSVAALLLFLAIVIGKVAYCGGEAQAMLLKGRVVRYPDTPMCNRTFSIGLRDPRHPFDWTDRERVRTDAEGGFSVSGVPMGLYDVEVRYEPHGTVPFPLSCMVERVRLVNWHQQVVVVCLEIGSLEAEVVEDSTGKPLNQFTATASRWESLGEGEFQSTVATRRFEEAGGRLCFPELLEGYYDVTISAPGLATTVERAVLVRTNQATPNVLIRMPRECVIQGVVRSSSGGDGAYIEAFDSTIVHGIRALVERENRPVLFAHTPPWLDFSRRPALSARALLKEDGTFRLTGLWPGEYYLELRDLHKRVLRSLPEVSVQAGEIKDIGTIDLE